MMNSELDQQIQATRYRSAKLCRRASRALVQQQELLVESFEELFSALDELQIAYQELRQQNQELVAAYEAMDVQCYRYHNLLELLPGAYVETDLNGILQEANCAAAILLNVPQELLLGKSLATFVSQKEYLAFSNKLTELHQPNQILQWTTRLHPHKGEAFDVTVKVVTLQHRDGSLRALGWLLQPSIPSVELSEQVLNSFPPA